MSGEVGDARKRLTGLSAEATAAGFSMSATVSQGSAWNGPVCLDCGRGYIGSHGCAPEVLVARADRLMELARQRFDALLDAPVTDDLAAKVEALADEGLCDDGQANDCRHASASGIDTTPIRDPDKVWRCDHCGLLWPQRTTAPESGLAAKVEALADGRREYLTACAARANAAKRARLCAVSCDCDECQVREDVHGLATLIRALLPTAAPEGAKA